MRRVVQERDLPVDRLRFFASSNARPARLLDGAVVEDVAVADHQVWISLCSAWGRQASREWAPVVAAAGAIVIDNSKSVADGPRRAIGRARGKRR